MSSLWSIYLIPVVPVFENDILGILLNINLCHFPILVNIGVKILLSVCPPPPPLPHSLVTWWSFSSLKFIEHAEWSKSRFYRQLHVCSHLKCVLWQIWTWMGLVMFQVCFVPRCQWCGQSVPHGRPGWPSCWYSSHCYDRWRRKRTRWWWWWSSWYEAPVSAEILITWYCVVTSEYPESAAYLMYHRNLSSIQCGDRWCTILLHIETSQSRLVIQVTQSVESF